MVKGTSSSKGLRKQVNCSIRYSTCTFVFFRLTPIYKREELKVSALVVGIAFKLINRSASSISNQCKLYNLLYNLIFISVHVGFFMGCMGDDDGG